MADMPRMRVAAVFDVMTHRSHANVILENFLRPFLHRGEWVDPTTTIEIISLCADDLSFAGSEDPRKRVNFAAEAAAEVSIPLFGTIAEAMKVGGATLAVDAVLSIGEGGGAALYGTTELGVPKYPRKRFFDDCVAVMREAGRFVPLFNDKHLSYSWEHAKEMYDVSVRHGFGLMAGSSVVLAQRLPPLGADLDVAGAGKHKRNLPLLAMPFFV